MTTQLNNMIGDKLDEERHQLNKHIRIATVLLSYFLGFLVATQKFASLFDYSSVLGWNYEGWYIPGMILVWGVKWWHVYENQIIGCGSLGVLVSSAVMFAYLIISRISSQSAHGNKYMHGSAHWASRDEIEQSGVLDNDEGVYVGAWQDEKGTMHYLRDSGPSHVLCFAPTRSGKGVGLVLPTLLSWKHSAIIADLKGELWHLTAGWRKKYANNKVICFKPGSPKGSAKWNPFDEIRIGTAYETADISSLSQIIVDPEGKGLEDHWARTANDFLSGCITHLLYKREREGTPANMNALDRMLADPLLPLDELYKEMVTYSHLEDGGTHPVASSSGQKMLDKPDNERGSVVSTAQSFLQIYRDPIVAQNTESSDFRLFDLMNHDTPVSLYLVTTPDNKDRLRPLLRTIVNWYIQKHTSDESLAYKSGRTVMAHKHRLLMMMDEFPSFGKLPAIAEGLAFVAGYGIKCYLITQDLTQLYQHYSKEESVTSNCHVQVAFPPNKVETAEYLSKLLGETTVIEEQFSESGKRASMLMGQVSKSVHAVKRPLLTPDEAMHLAGPKKSKAGDIIEAGEMVVNVSGFAPIRGRQPLYFKDPYFLARAQVEPPVKGDVLTRTFMTEDPTVKAEL